mmetsp:Transcript_68861/g.177405  ORF Transcript_68861/g.177405 Transcript_68861/m.177405 type:complete len:224 (+) Transcript_68861:61-732(+)
MARQRAQSFLLVLLGPLALLAQLPAGPSYAAPRARHVTRAAAEGTASNDALIGTWRYSGGAYKIGQSNDGKLLFRENALQGELKSDGDWLTADLPPAGTIRLKASDVGGKVVSNFKTANTDMWGDTVTALREWETLQQRTANLENELKGLVFEGKAADGGVVISLDGQQRPTAVQLSPEAAKAPNLSDLIKEAHDQATEASMDAMTEKLRQLYAEHFSAQDVL